MNIYVFLNADYCILIQIITYSKVPNQQYDSTCLDNGFVP